MSKKRKKLWKSKIALRENLHRSLPKQATEYFEAGRSAMAPGTTWQAMHAFRLQTKRFRYTLEVFREAYGPMLERRIELLKKLQTFLGDINDCVVTSSILADMPGTDSIREQLSQKAERKTGSLRVFWERVFDADGQDVLWRRYLGTYACRPRRQPRTRRLPPPARDGEMALYTSSRPS